MNKLLLLLLLVVPAAYAQEAPQHDRGTGPTMRIIGGDVAAVDAYPFMSSLVTRNPVGSGGHGCGATLIAPQWAITAAQCVEDAWREQDVVVGLHNILKWDVDGQRVEVTNTYIHPDFERFDLHAGNDIALLKLATAVTDVTPVAMATPAIMDAIATGDDLTVIGWGSTASPPHNLSAKLHEVVVPLVDADVCQAAAKSGDTITENMLCAGPQFVRKDFCYGDYGGPLMVSVDSVWYQVGVVSFNTDARCAKRNEYGVYTKISQYEDWILSKLSNVTQVDVDEFGPVAVNSTHVRVITLLNENLGTAVTYSNPTFLGASADQFSITGDTCTNVGISEGGTCTYTITLDAGVVPGYLDGSFHADVDVSGTYKTVLVPLHTAVLGEVNLATELDNSSLTFYSGGDGIWETEPNLGFGGSSARASRIGWGDRSFLQTEVEGPGQIKFSFGTSTYYWNALQFYVDGVLKQEWTGNNPKFRKKGQRVGSGKHVITWAYDRPFGFPHFEDTVYVDRVMWLPDVVTDP